MRRSLALAAALFIAAPGLASAQDQPHGDRGDGHWHGGSRGGQAAPAPRPAAPPAGQPQTAQRPGGFGAGGGGYLPQPHAGNIRDRRQLFTGPNDPAATPQDRAQLWGDRGGRSAPTQTWQGGDYGRGQARGGYGFSEGRSNGGDWRNGARDFQGGQRFRGGAYGGGAYGDGAYSGAGRAFSYGGRTYHRFHAEPYRWPDARWETHRWRRGGFLPLVFLEPNYLIDDYGAYGLEPAPYGYQWVRVGYDVLLVNTYSGEIVEVIPGVFW